MQQRPGGFRLWRLIPIGIAAVVILFQFLSAEKATNPETGKKVRVAMTEEQEEKLGLQSYQEVLSQSKVKESGPEVDMVRRVAERIAAATQDKNNHWAVAVVEDDTPNAFVLPGGKIVVFTGILKVAKTEGQLAAVLGHEVSHEIGKHAGQRMFQQQIMQTAMLGAQASMADMDYEQRRAVMGALGAGATYGYILPFSRDHESEADRMGVMYMARAGYNPQEAIDFWKEMAKSGEQKSPEFASTHPSNATRIADLEQVLPKAMEEYQKSGQKTGMQLPERAASASN